MRGRFERGRFLAKEKKNLYLVGEGQNKKGEANRLVADNRMVSFPTLFFRPSKIEQNHRYALLTHGGYGSGRREGPGKGIRCRGALLFEGVVMAIFCKRKLKDELKV